MKYRFFNWVINLKEVVTLEEHDSNTIFAYMKNGQKLNINLQYVIHKYETIKPEKEKLFQTFEELDS